MDSPTDVPKPHEVRAQLENLYAYRRFRGPKLRELLGVLVEEWLLDGGKNLSEMYIGHRVEQADPQSEEITRGWESEEERAARETEKEKVEREYREKRAENLEKQLRKQGQRKAPTKEPGKNSKTIIGEKFGYPKTRANLKHVRNRLDEYYATDGYSVLVKIKLNPGSYVPIITYNPVSAIPRLHPVLERLILRAKTAIDRRTVSGVFLAQHYWLIVWGLEMDVSFHKFMEGDKYEENLEYRARHMLVFPSVRRVNKPNMVNEHGLSGLALAAERWNELPIARMENPVAVTQLMFLIMVCASIMPKSTEQLRGQVADTISNMRECGIEPWECTFIEACAEACYEHRWTSSLRLFEIAIANSNGEAKYYWWYPALLANQGRVREAADILESAVLHFSRSNIATRIDLAMLQIIGGRFGDAEETLLASLDFTPKANPVLVYGFAVLYEAQDRLEEAQAWLDIWQDQIFDDLPVSVQRKFDLQWQQYSKSKNATLDNLEIQLDKSELDSLDVKYKSMYDHSLIKGMYCLIMGRMGHRRIVSARLAALQKDGLGALTSSVEIALAYMGLCEFDQAVEHLRLAAFKESSPLSMWFHVFPPLRHLRQHRGFRELVKQLGLPRQRPR